MQQNEETKVGLLIPKNRLSQAALQGLVDEYILRDGTDYGSREYSLDEKRLQVLKQIDSGKVQILFDPNSETTTLVTLEDLKKRRQQNFEILGSPAGL